MSLRESYQLTSRDFSILDIMLARTPARESAFLGLLRGKLATATVQNAVPHDVVTIDSRVEFTIDGGLPEDRILIDAEERSVLGLTLPITTLRGLALLGLRTSSTTTVIKPDGGREELVVRRVVHQPRPTAPYRSAFPPVAESQPPHLESRVVDLGPYLRSARRSRCRELSEPQDDDPGPQAA